LRVAGLLRVDTPTTAVCDNSTRGAMFFDLDANCVRACGTGGWTFVCPTGVLPPTNCTSLGSASTNPVRSCAALRAACPQAVSGTVWVQATGQASATQVQCDQTIDGGRWTMIARASDTNSVGNDWEFDVASGGRPVVHATHSFGLPSAAQYQRGLLTVLDSGTTRIDVMYRCYLPSNVAGTEAWVVAYSVDAVGLAGAMTTGTSEYFEYNRNLKNKNGDVSTSGLFAQHARGGTGSVVCSNGYAGQSGAWRRARDEGGGEGAAASGAHRAPLAVSQA
jgi:hypothetical protein